MEKTVCFLLLLLCSPSTAQLQSHTDNNITDPGEQNERWRREAWDATNQEKICLQEIPTILRKLSASVADQKVKMKLLQRENKAQEAKLESQRAEMERQKQKDKAQEAKLESQRAELERQKVEVERQKVEVEELKQNLKVKQVAFSASLASGSKTLGPYNTHTPLVFKHVFTNIGNAYSPVTGHFTAPVRGAYHFEFYIGAFGHANHASGAVLVKNGENVFLAWELQNNGYGTSANGATLLLEVGDVVFLRLWRNTRIYDNENRHSTFSGHLLFTM